MISRAGSQVRKYLGTILWVLVGAVGGSLALYNLSSAVGIEAGWGTALMGGLCGAVFFLSLAAAYESQHNPGA